MIRRAAPCVASRLSRIRQSAAHPATLASACGTSAFRALRSWHRTCNELGIGDGYRVELRIIVWQKDDVLKVPTSSLFRHEGKWAVYRVDGDVAVRQLVEIGQRNGLEAEVTAGLEAGQRIIVYPSDAIADGIKVRARS